MDQDQGQANQAEQQAELEAQITALAAEKEECEVRAMELIAKEVAGQGMFATEIFELKQSKQRLGTEIQHLKVKLNHLLLNRI